MGAFETLEQIGEGTYGQVYRARDRVSNQIVALKKVRMEHEKEGFPITAIREIKILKELRHKNIIDLREIVTSKETTPQHASRAGQKVMPPGPTSIYLVFEFMDHDLTGLMEQPNFRWFQPEHIKCYVKQLLQGLHFCHRNNVLHRDIKGSNLLIDNRGQLKLGDFGLARPLLPTREGSPPSHYTNRVITLWYRPPELLLGATEYGPAVDMWSVGCIVAELLVRKPLFPGLNEVDQLECIMRVCGSPSADTWPAAERLPWYATLRHVCVPPEGAYRRRVRELLKSVPADALELVDRLLALDPARRPSASEALDANYFWSDPMPAEPASLPKYPSSHEFTTKKRRPPAPPAPASAAPAAAAPDLAKRSRVGDSAGGAYPAPPPAPHPGHRPVHTSSHTHHGVPPTQPHSVPSSVAPHHSLPHSATASAPRQVAPAANPHPQPRPHAPHPHAHPHPHHPPHSTLAYPPAPSAPLHPPRTAAVAPIPVSAPAHAGHAPPVHHHDHAHSHSHAHASRHGATHHAADAAPHSHRLTHPAPRSSSSSSSSSSSLSPSVPAPPLPSSHAPSLHSVAPLAHTESAPPPPPLPSEPMPPLPAGEPPGGNQSSSIEHS